MKGLFENKLGVRTEASRPFYEVGRFISSLLAEQRREVLEEVRGAFVLHTHDFIFPTSRKEFDAILSSLTPNEKQ